MNYFINYDFFRLYEDNSSSGYVSTSGTSGLIDNSDEVALNDKIQEWNTQYSQAFKFQNDMPKNINSPIDLTIIGQKNLTNDTSITNYNNELLNKVKEGINKMAELLSSKNGEKFIFDKKSINVLGHTSSPAEPAYNLALSKRRSDFVIASIKSAMNTLLNGAPININFVSVPKGETDLIIINDTTNGDAILNPNNKEINGTIDVKLYQTPEQKQALNRRVTIGLDKFPVRYKEPVKEEKEKILIKSSPEELPVINPTDVKFNTDSYILTSKSEAIINTFVNKVLEAIKNNANLTDIYICSHSHKGIENDIEDIQKQENKIFYISLNRAVSVMLFLENKGITSVKYHLIPCSYLIPNGTTADDNKRVEIFFSVTDNVKKAKNAFNKLSNKYSIESNNGEYTGKKILTNKVLRSDVLKDVIAYLKYGEKRKLIPLELWYDEYGALENGLREYKKELENAVHKYGKNKFSVEDFVYTKK